jgi:hypothetical protein
MALVTAFIVTGMTMVGALAAVIVVRGGWEAGAVGIGVLGFFGFLLLVAAVGAESDALARRG